MNWRSQSSEGGETVYVNVSRVRLATDQQTTTTHNNNNYYYYYYQAVTSANDTSDSGTGDSSNVVSDWHNVIPHQQKSYFLNPAISVTSRSRCSTFNNKPQKARLPGITQMNLHNKT